MLPLKGSLRIICLILLIVYLGLLAKNILFKKSPSYYKNYFKREYRYYSIHDGWKNANTKPFNTIRLFYNSRNLNPEYKQNNLWGNFVGFIPLGILLPLIFAWFRNGVSVVIAGFLLSLLFETAQLVFGLGIFDVDDLILNTAGTIGGFIIVWPFRGKSLARK